ncbi:related to peroxisome assembly protein PAS10 [Cephalotrichum gorgonifer]|uniref:Peroxisome assembly protein 12 n=1 Tax=Cephalotrichum gorgonifer TaxID=2041049 RepID=A0AAE8SS25_9PEZI|nr:related to peroxisome assembly protein PAS10 [Cephalotrichum gorgonifer]
MEFVAALQASIDDQKPSLFELLSEQELSGLLPPTVRYLLTLATHRYPRHLLRALNSFDELYALLMLVVERHYLRTRGGSFTENFYGLKREKALSAEIPRASIAAPDAVKDALRLDGADVWRNLAVSVGVPYLKRKLDEGYDINAPRALLGVAYTRMPENPSWGDWIAHYYRRFLLRVYPSVNAAYYLAVLGFNLAYLFDNTKYHDPLMWLIGTRVRRMTQADFRAAEKLAAGAKSRGGAPGLRTLLTSPRAMGSAALSGLSVALPMSIFALKFLEWWHASDFAKQLGRKAAEGVELPPPVVSASVPAKKGSKGTAAVRGGVGKGLEGNGEEEEGREGGSGGPRAEDAPVATPSMLPILTVKTPSDSSMCPICEGDIVTATACQTGVVYCYTCVHRWIEGVHPKQEEFMADRVGKWESGKGRCAVTGRRVLGGTEGLRRIMI